MNSKVIGKLAMVYLPKLWCFVKLVNEFRSIVPVASMDSGQILKRTYINNCVPNTETDTYTHYMHQMCTCVGLILLEMSSDVSNWHMNTNIFKTFDIQENAC
jgi:hypothetical protein